MSGGVDSSVAAALLKEQGNEVIGVTMCLGITEPRSKGMACCSAESIEDAKKVCRRLDIKHQVFSFSKEMQEYIVDDFIGEYLQGRTPNPCIRCNQYLKFGKLLQQAKAIGADYIATGHYARIEHNEKNGSYSLRKGKDPVKDQTYFLYSIQRSELPFILFPLGNMEKEQVRNMARELQLPVAEKHESQDVCFVPDGGYTQFIRERLGEKSFMPGDFINEKGDVVGKHKGIFNYTIGQREKLGIALGYPAYIYRIDTEKNNIYVGPKDMLLSKGLIAKSANFVSIDPPEKTIEVMAKVRYQAKEVRAKIGAAGDGHLKVDFHEPVAAVTPGQSVVFYDEDILLGGAIIDKVTE
jgi:tRNA-specific 2-thiouridylase